MAREMERHIPQRRGEKAALEVKKCALAAKLFLFLFFFLVFFFLERYQQLIFKKSVLILHSN